MTKIKSTIFFCALISFIVSLAIGTFSFLAAVNFFDCVSISAVIFLQMITGMIAWLIFSNQQTTKVPELIGLGLAFGSLIALLSEYVFRATEVRDISWIFPSIIFAMLIFNPQIQIKLQNISIEKTPSQDLAFLASSSIAAISFYWIWCLPLAIIPYALISLRKQKNRRVWVLLSVVSLFVSQFLKGSSTSWYVYSHDQMYLEGFSESIYRYGPGENIHLLGYGFPYHWFSLLWSAVISHSAHLAPLIALTKILPIAALVASICLLWMIVIRHSRISGYIAVLIFVLGSNAINWSAIRFTNSPTFLFSMIWLLAFIYLFQLVIDSSSLLMSCALGLLLIGAFGGKVTHGVVLLAGFGCLMLFIFIDRKSRQLILPFSKLFVILSVSTLVAYLIAYRGEQVGGRMLYFSPGELGFQVGVAYMSSARIIWILTTVAVLAGCSLVFCISLYRESESHNEKLMNFFILSSYLVSLILTFVLAQEGGSQGYFLLSASVLTVIPASKVIAALIADFEPVKDRTFLMMLGLISTVFVFGSRFFWNQQIVGLDLYRSGLLLKILTLTLPLLIFCIAVFINRAKFLKNGILSLLAIIFLFGFSLRLERASDYFSSFSRQESYDPISGSRKRVAALNWLRENSSEEDIVATNRFCIPEVDPCIEKWYLVSAISQRRLLIEGFGYGLPVGNPVQIAQERMFKSMDFGRNPNQQLWKYLKSYDVRWFVIDSAVESLTNSWEPYAKIVYQNSEMKILRLSNHL